MAKPKPKRDRPVLIRFTEEEYSLINQKAIASKLTFSELVRSAALEQPLPLPRSETAIATYKQLVKLGSNVNQLARATNQAVKMGYELPVTAEHWQKVYQIVKQLGLELTSDR